MATPANWGKLVSFIAGERKPALIPFGYFSPNDNLGFIASIPLDPGSVLLVITGTQNGINTTFTTNGAVGKLFVNGVLQKSGGVDYTLTTSPVGFTLVIPPQSDDILQAFTV